MKIKKEIVISIIILLILLGIFFYGNEEEGKECVRISSTCCPCNMGGEEVCVLRTEEESYKEKLANCSKDIFCAAVYNCNKGKCQYVDNECKFVELKE